MAEPTAPRTSLRVGAMVRGKYRIDAFIASGSMANVYAATHRNGSRVALKILHKDLARDTSFAERFRREGYFGNAVVHPGIVRAIDDDMTDDGCAFLVFELLEGETLEQKRERAGGKLTLSEVLNVGDAVLDILQAAHDHQILHRDLKPDNVYLARKAAGTEAVRLLDFGAARFNDAKSTSELTGVGMVLGTPAFMAPEQAAGKRGDVDARSDVWGVGAMLFACLTGQAVHLGGDLKTKAIAAARTKARSLREVAPEIPRVVAAVIDRALAFDKAERYADAKSMREALGWARRSLTGEDDRPVMSEDPPTKRHPISSEATLPDSDSALTIAGRVQSIPDSRETLDDEENDEETEKRTKIGERAVELLSRAPHIKKPVPAAASEGVLTSAPPVTLRERQPPSMPPSEGPTFSLRQDPVFSLREGREKARASRPAPNELTREEPGQLRQGAPVTERLPRPGSEPDTPKAVPGPADPGALFRAALERGMQATTNESLTGQVGAVSPAHAARVIVEATPLPAPMPRAPVPLVMPGDPSGFGAAHAMSPMHAMGPGLTGPPPPGDDPVAKAQFRSESVSTHFPPGADQFSSVRPGPLVSSVTAKPRGSGWRIVVPILIGILAGVATYVLVMRQKAARAHPQPEPVVSVAPSVTASEAPVPPVLPPPPSVAVSASAPPVASVAPSASVAKKPRPKPKPKAPPAAEPAPPAPDPPAE